MAELAGREFNRISRSQLAALGLGEEAIRHRIDAGRLVAVEQAVFAVAPVLEHDDWGLWMGATLTAPETKLSHVSAAAALGFLSLPRPAETVTRPGSGGPRRHGGLRVYRSSTLEGDCTELNGIPITSVARTLLDPSAKVSDRALARAVREAVRVKLIDLDGLGDALGYRGRRGSGRLAATVARCRGLPLERARSGAEIRAVELLAEASGPLRRLNARINEEEADLSWPAGPAHRRDRRRAVPPRRRGGRRKGGGLEGGLDGPYRVFPRTTSTAVRTCCWPVPSVNVPERRAYPQ